MADTIKCPSCGCAIEVTEVLSAQLRMQIRKEVALEWHDREAELTQDRAAVEADRIALALDRKSIDQEIERRMHLAKKRFKSKALKRAREALAGDLAAKDAELAEVRSKLQQAKELELQLRKERQRLEDDKQNFELIKTRELDAERTSIRETARQQIEEQHRLKFGEYEKRIADMAKELDAARRIADQGSQQLQGEVLELDLEEVLRQQFPTDEIRPVSKGVRGADVVQVVRDSSLAECGKIIWESKRTANWSHTWLPKLRDDQRAENACIAILVTEKCHPKMATAFDSIDGIWVTNRSCSMALALALRSGLIDIAAARRALEGQQGKMEVLYDYLSNSTFKNRMTGIVEAFTTMQKDLIKEKKAVTAAWAKREQQIFQALKNASGLYGDLQGIIGGQLPAVESLEFAALLPADVEADEIAEIGFLPR